MTNQDPQSGDATAGDEPAASPVLPDPVAADQPATGSTATGTPEAAPEPELSITDELLGASPTATDPTPAATGDEGKPDKEPQADDRKPPAEGEQADDRKPEAESDEPNAEELAKLPAPSRGRIKNLLNERSALRSEIDQHRRAFSSIDQALAGVPPADVPLVLREMGAAIRGDAAARDALAKRLGLTVAPAAPAAKEPAKADPPAPAEVPAHIEKAAKTLEDYGEEDAARELRAAHAKPASAPQAQEPEKPQATPPAPKAPSEDPAYQESVQSMRSMAEQVRGTFGAQAEPVLKSIGERFQAMAARIEEETGIPVPPKSFARLFARAKDQVVQEVSATRRPAPPGLRSDPPRQPVKQALSITDELIAGHP